MPDSFAGWNETLRPYVAVSFWIFAGVYASVLLTRLGTCLATLIEEVRLLGGELRVATQDAYGDVHLKTIVGQLHSIQSSLDMRNR